MPGKRWAGLAPKTGTSALLVSPVPISHPFGPQGLQIPKPHPINPVWGGLRGFPARRPYEMLPRSSWSSVLDSVALPRALPGDKVPFLPPRAPSSSSAMAAVSCWEEKKREFY